MLTGSSYRRDAERVRDDMAALPGPERAVALLERLAVKRRPLLAAS
jgi:UDP:flavonoid glycosyltransferase YjiC (YdhE family)